MKTMLHLPDRIEVRLTDASGRPLRIAKVILAIRFFLDAKYYYGDLLSLTDLDGATAAHRDDLRARFEENRRLFPMDYPMDLESCDPGVQLVILDPGTIRERLKNAPENAMISRAARDLYAQAQNQQVMPTDTSIELPTTYTPVITANLVTDKADSGIRDTTILD